MKVLNERCRKGFALLAFFVSMSAAAHVDSSNVCEWRGTAYHEGGWFTYQMSAPYAEGNSTYEDGAMKFDKSDSFALSPLYPAPIRKVVVKAACNSATPTRFLKIAPFVDGAEALALTNSLSATTDLQSQTFDFPSSANVTAFRLFAGSGNGNWGVTDICVFYGEKTADEDAELLKFASQLPAPENLRAEAIAADALTVAADAVAGASGYRFEVFRLDGTPETVSRENFDSGPSLSAQGWELSAPGWTMTASPNASIDVYTSSGNYDSSTSVKRSLKIGAASTAASAGDVNVSVLTPVFGAAISECSFFCKVGVEGKSDVFRVLGRADSLSSEWIGLLEFDLAGRSGTNVTVSVDAANLDIRQVKFEFSAAATNFSTAAWDSLRVVYGGDETRTPVAGGAVAVAEPLLALSSLDCGRYAFRAQAVGGVEVRDSSWTEERVVDLSWAGIVVSEPTGIDAVQSGAAIAVSWDAVASAESYRVTVVSADEPDVALDCVEVAGTEAEVPVAAIGDYSVAVTAISPGGVSQATSGWYAVTVSLGRLGAVAAEATDVSEITATWAPVALAEGYRVNVYRLAGEGERVLAGTESVTACSATFGGLDPSATYVVEAIPQPSDGASLGAASEAVDLSAAHFRKTGAAPLPRDGWTESFDALAGMTADTEVKRIGLDYWQFARGSAEPEKLLYASGKKTTGGVYAFSDPSHGTDSYALGSLATKSYGCAFGIALANVGELAARDMELSFDVIQRTYNTNPAMYVLEWKVTDGETEILSAGGWREVELAGLEQWASGDEGCPEVEHRQHVSALSLPAQLAPGETLVLRWRHPNVASGPMLAIDNVRLEFRRQQRALRMTVR